MDGCCALVCYGLNVVSVGLYAVLLWAEISLF